MGRPKATVIKALRRHLPRESRLLLAVSGGSDSMALLRGCFSLRAVLNVDLAVAHLDHGLRPSSRADLEFVSRVAES